MVEPEEPGPPLRRVFEKLEAEFEAGLRHEAERETVAAIRAEVGATPLWAQLARRVGAEEVARAGARLLRGTLVASYPDFFVLETPEGGQHLVRAEAASLALPPGRATLQPLPAATTTSRSPARARQAARTRQGRAGQRRHR
jgi:hypothetical protein